MVKLFFSRGSDRSLIRRVMDVLKFFLKESQPEGKVMGKGIIKGQTLVEKIRQYSCTQFSLDKHIFHLQHFVPSLF